MCTYTYVYIYHVWPWMASSLMIAATTYTYIYIHTRTHICVYMTWDCIAPPNRCHSIYIYIYYTYTHKYIKIWHDRHPPPIVDTIYIQMYICIHTLDIHKVEGGGWVRLILIVNSYDKHPPPLLVTLKHLQTAKRCVDKDQPPPLFADSY